MAMKETEGSLRAYFLLAGAVSTLNALNEVTKMMEITGELPLSGSLVVLWFAVVANLGLGLAFVAAGIKLKAMLPTGASAITQMLLMSIAVLVLEASLIAGFVGTGVGTSLIGLAITIYLLASVRRLAREAVARAGLPPARVA
jgi:divalent metal cation (Fe/Co/Zn/Cd) transporter